MTSKLKQQAKIFLFLTALAAASSWTSSLSILAKGDKKAEEAQEIAAAQKLFEDYQRLDRACDPKLCDLYAADAKIESEVERKDAPTLKEKYDREKFCKLINKTFADPGLAKISSTTEYDQPKIRRARIAKHTVEVEFHAYQGDTAMKVVWHVRQNADGQWQIVKENALTFRKSIGPAKIDPVKKEAG